MNKALLSFVFWSFSIFSHAQQVAEPCGHVAYLDYLESQDPGIKSAIDKAYQHSLNLANSKAKMDEIDTVYTIQVVFHIVYNNGVENLNEEHILSQMDVLNNSYRRRNADTVNTRAAFEPVAADTRIQFELASTDPSGNPTNGILRVPTSRTSFLTTGLDLSEADQVKAATFGSTAWDTDKYLNIWVCDLSVQGFDLLLGYAYPPTGAANWNFNSFATSDRQGVVCHYKVIGLNNPLSTNTGAKTLVHEVGHYLGLRHVWGDGQGNQGCTANFDDGLDDTPYSRTSSAGCNQNKNTCNTGAGDLPDQIENYMDYSDEDCQNMFTNDQRDMMRSNLRLFRSGIVSEKDYPKPAYTNTQVFPNPTIGELNISIADVDATKTYRIEFTNMLGQRIFDMSLASVNFQNIQVDLGMRGVYYYQIIQDEDTVLKEEQIVFMN